MKLKEVIPWRKRRDQDSTHDQDTIKFTDSGRLASSEFSKTTKTHITSIKSEKNMGHSYKEASLEEVESLFGQLETKHNDNR